MHRASRTALTLGIGAFGAALASSLGLPAAVLIGSSLAVSATAASGARMTVPNALRNGGFTVIGASLGAGITPDFVHDLAAWPLSLGLLAVSILATVLVSAALLTRVFHYGRDTALLASSPGTMSYVLALAAEGRGDGSVILVLQSMRLLLIATGLPLALAATQTMPDAAHVLARPATGWAVGLALLAASYGLGLAGTRAGLPAAYLLAGMAASGVLHGADLAHGVLPPALTAAGYVITGSVIGARFSGIPARQIGRMALLVLATVSASAAVAAVFAAAAARAMGLPWGQAWVAFAPGGVEAMAAMALALGYDPAYVAVHHVFRIVLLVFLMPALLRWGGKRD